MIEYAVVNLNDKFNKDLKKMIESQREEAEKSKTAELEVCQMYQFVYILLKLCTKFICLFKTHLHLCC